MKSFVLFIISRIYGLLSIVLRPLIKIDNKAILFWSWKSKQYNCNPKAISDYLYSQHKGEYKLYWSFKRQFPKTQNDGIMPLKWGTWRYLLTALKCKFLISNTRNDIESMLFYKRKDQLYIMTWHAGMSLKKVEYDAVKSLSNKYIKISKADSKNCNLMLSGSNFQTELFNNSFWYDGEIINQGTPRNDVLFSKNTLVRHDICQMLSIKENCIIVLYAPTFRSVFNSDTIYFNWDNIKEAIRNNFKQDAILLVKLHPNIQNKVSKLKFDFNRTDCIDVTAYQDIQNLLIATDVLITDYSSSMFDYSLMNKPCFLLVKDRKEYDRGFYIPLDHLPFDISENEIELKQNIMNFNVKAYLERLHQFNTNVIGSTENGMACAALYNWLRKNTSCNNKN